LDSTANIRSRHEMKLEKVMKKLALLLAALLGMSASAIAITINIGINDRPYYVHGPGYWYGGVYYVWAPGYWEWHHHHKRWHHGYYRIRR
jgi:FtsH-binding integral membrane protein